MLNKITEIKPLVTRTYTFPLQEAFEVLPAAQRLADDEWKPLPERFLEGVEFVSRFTGSDINDRSAAYLPLAHVMGAKAFATDNKTLVEYDLGGAAPFDMHLASGDVRLLRAFGGSPSQVGEAFDPRTDESWLCFRWATGATLALPMRSMTIPDALTSMVASLDWSDMNEVDDQWRSQIVGQFSVKPARNESDLLHIYPDRIETAPDGHHPLVCLAVATHSPVYTVYDRARFIPAVKLADQIKFIGTSESSRLLFCTGNARGVLASFRVQA